MDGEMPRCSYPQPQGTKARARAGHRCWGTSPWRWLWEAERLVRGALGFPYLVVEGTLLGLGLEVGARLIGTGERHGPKGGELGRRGAGKASRWFGP